MTKKSKGLGWNSLFLLYLLVFSGLIVSAVSLDKVITVVSENLPIENRKCFIIDAGHGGIDGGATSCTGILESSFNLDISLRLNDLMQLLGMETYMIRTTDTSIHTVGDTIAAIKVSDLKERVRIVNGTDNALLVSIHQNYFRDNQYFGAQVFYSPNDESKILATQMQSELIRTLNPESNRATKRASGIYLMEHVQCPAILIECGFISNYEEEAKLRNPAYQKRLCCVIAATLSQYASA